MKRIILLLSVFLVTSSLYSQEVNYNDTLVDGIDAQWDNTDIQIDGDTNQVAAMNIQEIITTWIAPEPEPVLTNLSEEDLASIAQDVQFLADLPKSYTDLPKEDLKNIYKRYYEWLKNNEDSINLVYYNRYTKKFII